MTETGRPAGRSRTSLLGYGTLACVTAGGNRLIRLLTEVTCPVPRYSGERDDRFGDLNRNRAFGTRAPGSPPQLNLTPTASATPLDSFNGRARGVIGARSSPRSRTRTRLSGVFGGESGVTSVLKDTVQPNRAVTYGETNDRRPAMWDVSGRPDSIRCSTGYSALATSDADGAYRDRRRPPPR